MFDELHDPTPPSADSSQFAAVAERAAGMRRRRNTIIGSISAVAVLGVGAIGVATLNDSDPDDNFGTATAPATTTASSIVPGTNAPGGSTTMLPTTTVEDPAMTTPPSMPRDLAISTTPVFPDPRVGGDGLPGCTVETRCDFANLPDGRLGQLNQPAAPGEPYLFSVYDTDGGVGTGSLDRDFTPPSASLLAIGPGDIAYLWWVEATDGDPVGTVTAFEIASGERIRDFSDVVGFSGDTELVPTAEGFVPVGCCGPDTLRPAADAEIRVPWVDASGDPVVADERAHFSVATTGVSMVIEADRPGDDDGLWTVGWDGAVRGMPFLWELNDGSAVVVRDGAEATSDPVFLLPDGTTRTVASPGTVVHVLADGRFIVSAPGERERLVDVRPDATSTPDPSPTAPAAPDTVDTTTTSLLDVPPTTAPAPPPAPQRPVVAINTDGDAVYFSARSLSDPILVADGFDPDEIDPNQEGPGPNVIDAVAVSEVGDVAVVSSCCEPVSGAIDTTSLSGDPIGSGPGYAPSVGPTGERLAVAEFGGGLSVRTDRISDDTVTIAGDTTGSFSAWDSMWVDLNTVAVLGPGASGWEIRVFDVRPESAAMVSTTTIGPFDGFDDGRYQFAGHPTESTIGVHRAGTAAVTIYGFDGANLVVTGERDLAESVTSIWYDGPVEIVVTTDFTLTVAGITVPGEYRWART